MTMAAIPARADFLNCGHENGRVPLELILEQQRDRRGLHFGHETNPVEVDGQPVLGEISFSPLRIVLYGERHTHSLRQRFTLAHELGHFFLDHGKYLAREYRDARDDLDLSVRAPVLRDVQRLEWQANYFAACLLLPHKQFVRDFLTEAVRNDVVDRGFGPLFVDNQRCNLENYYQVTGALRWDYGVSRSVVRLRLIGLGLMTEQQRWKGAIGARVVESIKGPANRGSAKFDFRRLAQSLHASGAS